VEDQPFFHGGNPEAFDFPGFRVAPRFSLRLIRPLADSRGLPGMTIELCNELQNRYTRRARNSYTNIAKGPIDLDRGNELIGPNSKYQA